MKKIKIFRNAEAYKLEDLVNDFIKDKNVISIKHNNLYITNEYKNGIPSKGIIYDTIIIFYEE